MRSLSQLTVSQQGLAFNPATGHSFMLNRSGMFILNALQSGRDHQQAASLLGEEYALRSDDAERDVNDFLSRLRTFGLI